MPSVLLGTRRRSSRAPRCAHCILEFIVSPPFLHLPALDSPRGGSFTRDWDSAYSPWGGCINRDHFSSPSGQENRLKTSFPLPSTGVDLPAPRVHRSWILRGPKSQESSTRGRNPAGRSDHSPGAAGQPPAEGTGNLQSASACPPFARRKIRPSAGTISVGNQETNLRELQIEGSVSKPAAPGSPVMKGSIPASGS
jgi:hypothetical protein